MSRSAELYREALAHLDGNLDAVILKWARQHAGDTKMRDVADLIATVQSIAKGTANDVMQLGRNSREIDAPQKAA